jgi:hypothetical protein
MPNEQYLERLRSYLKHAENDPAQHISFTVLAIQHLGEGVTVVYDSMGEFDTYFDREKWYPTMPEIWEDSLYPPVLEPLNLGVLQGIGQAPAVRSFEMALAFTKRQLKPKSGVVWHEPIPEAQEKL